MDKGKQITVAGIAKLVEGELVGDGAVTIREVASLAAATEEAVSFFGNPRFKEDAASSRAGALIVKEALPLDTPQVVVPDPYAAFVKVVQWFYPETLPEPGVHPSAVVDAGAELGGDVHVGPLAVIQKEAKIGARSVIGAGCVIGTGCLVGEDCRLLARVTLYPRVRLGRKVIIHSGTVIGSPGFGYVLSDSGHIRKPQVGTVIVEDEVEMGANCTIDRAMLDATVIGAGTKMDNLVHLAHNVRVGKHCIILAGAVVGGSVSIGDYCIISGNVTIKDNITLGDRVTVIGHSGVVDDVPPGRIVFGYPDMPFSHAKRVYSRLKQLPELFKRVRKIEKDLNKGSG